MSEADEKLEQMDTNPVHEDMEEGELMEEGEINDDDDNDIKPMEKLKESKIALPPKKAYESKFVSKTLPTSLSQPKSSSSERKEHPRYKDYDSKAASKTSSSSMIDSWVSGIQKKSSSRNATLDDIDPNEEYYGTNNGKEKSVEVEKIRAEDVDLRRLPGSEDVVPEKDLDFRFVDMEVLDHRDKDYRRESIEDEKRETSPRERSPRYREERRRRRSPTPEDYRSKRSREASPPYRDYRERRERRGAPPPPRKTRWTEHTICKFFREGFCRDGDNCAYSHNSADSHRRPELCKFYHNGYCKKGLHCPLLHGEYPCKAFHKGECSKEQCQYSHQPLNEFTQPIFDQMMKDEELAAKIMIPNQPLRRKVLLPGGPDPNQPEPVIDPLTGQIPPPKVVVPVLASQTGGIHVHSSFDAPIGSGQTFGFFNPITPVTQSQPQTLSQSVLAAQQTASLISSFLQPKFTESSGSSIASILDTKPKSPHTEPTSTTFNINQMLEKITQGVVSGFNNEIDESPASPPLFDTSSVAEGTTPMLIPSSKVKPWKLILLDIDPWDINFDINWVQKMGTNSAMKNDPRMKKLAEKQFDRVSSLIQHMPKEGPVVVTQTYSPSTGTVTSMMSPGSSSAQQTTQVTTTTIPNRDPRMRDPRKKALANANSGTSSILSLPMPPTSTLSNASTPAMPSPSIPAIASAASNMPVGGNPKNLDDETLMSMVEQQIKMSNQLAQQVPGDTDHRHLYAPTSATAQSSLYAPIAPRVPGANNSPPTDFGFGNTGVYRPPPPKPQRYANPVDPRSAGYYGNQGDYSPSQARWEHPNGSPPTDGSGALSPPTQGNEINMAVSNNMTNNASSAPLSLREKRKNNEYESPLGRARAAY